MILILIFSIMKRVMLIGRGEFLRQGILAGAALSFGIRQYCRRGSIVTAGVLATPRSRHLVPMVYSRPALDSNLLVRFVDPVPIMPVAKPVGTRVAPNGATVPFYRMQMTQFTTKVHRDLPPTRVWGFNGSVPGPTFEVQSGSAVLVDWINNLPAKHFLPIDQTIHGAEADKPEVRTVVHLHGAVV